MRPFHLPESASEWTHFRGLPQSSCSNTTSSTTLGIGSRTRYRLWWSMTSKKCNRELSTSSVSQPWRLEESRIYSESLKWISYWWWTRLLINHNQTRIFSLSPCPILSSPTRSSRANRLTKKILTLHWRPETPARRSARIVWWIWVDWARASARLIRRRRL